MKVVPVWSVYNTMSDGQLNEDLARLEADKLKNPQNAVIDEQEEECLEQLQKLGRDFQKTGSVADAEEMNALDRQLWSLMAKNHVPLVKV